MVFFRVAFPEPYQQLSTAPRPHPRDPHPSDPSHHPPKARAKPRGTQTGFSILWIHRSPPPHMRIILIVITTDFSSHISPIGLFSILDGFPKFWWPETHSAMIFWPPKLIQQSPRYMEPSPTQHRHPHVSGKTGLMDDVSGTKRTLVAPPISGMKRHHSVKSRTISFSRSTLDHGSQIPPLS